jgi:hypothetical protein
VTSAPGDDVSLPSGISDDTAAMCHASAAAAEAELRPILDELHRRPVPMSSELGQPAAGWAWLARGGRSA